MRKSNSNMASRRWRLILDKSRLIRYLWHSAGLRTFRGFGCISWNTPGFLTLAPDFPPRWFQCGLRTRIEINSWNNHTATGSHFNPLPILFARINSPLRPQTNPSTEQIRKSRACTQEHGRKGDRRQGHATLYYYYCSKESSGIERFLQQSRIRAGWRLYGEHFRADNTERRTRFTPQRQDGTKPLCWHAHIYWTLTLLPNCDNLKAKLSEKQVLLRIRHPKVPSISAGGIITCTLVCRIKFDHRRIELSH